MRLGYLAPLTLDNIATARLLGYDALEADIGWGPDSRLDSIEGDLPVIRDALAANDITINALAIYGPAIETPYDETCLTYSRAMRLARALGCSVVAGMTGRVTGLSVQENLPLFERYFASIASQAEDMGVRIAFEPWPGRVLGHGPNRWVNLATTPELWGMLFDAVSSPALGLEYDPSHLVWQGIDYLQAIRDFGERIFHVHAKDTWIDSERLRRVGNQGRGWWRYVLPGLGVIDWQAVFEALREVGYPGDMSVESEDPTYQGERWNEGLAIALRFLRPLANGLA